MAWKVWWYIKAIIATDADVDGYPFIVDYLLLAILPDLIKVSLSLQTLLFRVRQPAEDVVLLFRGGMGLAAGKNRRSP